MKVIFVSIGSHGDVLPFIGLAAEMRRRSYNVLLAAPGHFEELSARAGLPFHPLGSRTDYDAAIAHRDLWHPRKGASLLLQYALKLMPLVDDFLGTEAERGPIVVVASTLSLGARIAQDRLGLDVVTVHLAPFIFRSRIAPPILPGVPLPRWLPNSLKHSIQLGAEKYVLNPACLPTINAYRAKFNLSAVDRLRTWWHSPQRIILMTPIWFATPQDDWPHRTVQTGFPRVDHFGDAGTLPPSLAAFLKDGEPPLVFTYGSAMRQAERFFETAVALCRRMGRRGVLLAPQNGQIPHDLPACIISVPYAPLSALLPHSAALVHHGGIGTVAEGLAAGVPQLIVPVAFDHFDEGERLRRLGVGMTLSRRRFTPSRASRCLNTLLHSSAVGKACKEAKERTAQENGIKVCCGIIERFLKRTRGPPANQIA